jgi:hypothetical protein
MNRRNLLNELVKLHDANDTVKRGIESYSRQMDLPDFKLFKDMLLTIKGSILADMFSSDFTDLDATEKDVLQRTYFHMNTVLDFLIAPSRYIQKRKERILSHVERQTIAKRQASYRANERKE